MARLPTIGGDTNDWGSVLNDFLQQALNDDGTLVTIATNPYTTNPNTNLASALQPGLVQLTGDLSNTATAPMVAGLQGYAVSTEAPSDGNVLTWSAGDSQWEPEAPSGGGGGGDDYTGDIDGGDSTSVYGGATAIDCGDST